MSLGAYGQNDSLVRPSSPYRTEYNPWYKLSTFKRGFHSDSLTDNLDQLEAKPREQWSRKDSLDFAQASLHTGNIPLSEYYFDRLKLDYNRDQSFWWDQMMIYILNKDYELGIESIHKSSPGILQFSKIYFLDKILLAYIANDKNEKWYKTGHVFNWDVDSSLFIIDKSNPQFNAEVIDPLQNLDFVLRELIHFVHEDDPVISKACFEMGIIFENHISLTQAYIAYSLGRQYNKSDKELLNSVKQVKAKLTQKKYKIPNFRKYFPKIKQWRFEYEVLKEKIYLQQTDTIPPVPTVLMVPVEEVGLPFEPEIIIIAGILLLFILVLFFLKTKKT
ncbi:MAG: hypothetical protein ACI8ZM_000657 [Crocinitomix sp.]|jgi:hypothetical protein